jgi:hypothetical protein
MRENFIWSSSNNQADRMAINGVTEEFFIIEKLQMKSF